MRNNTLFIMPDDGVQAVVSLIEQACTEILVKQFRLGSDAVLDALHRSFIRGVSVKIMLNPHTSEEKRENDTAFARLQGWNMDVAWTNPSFAVTHEKSMVIDNRLALVSSFNLDDLYFTKTRDYGIVANDPKIVQQVAEGFHADWNRKEFHPDMSTGLVWSPKFTRLEIARVIDSSKESLFIQHPKYSDITILERIVFAAMRGVKVHVLCGGKHGLSELDIFDAFASFRLMAASGVKLRKQKHLKLHAKLILVDGRFALLGSSNLDRSAFDLRRELSIETDDAKVVKRLESTFLNDWEEAPKYEPPNLSDESALLQDEIDNDGY